MVQAVRSRNDRTLLLDAGNALWSQQPLALQTQSRIVIEAMNLLGYSAMAIGDLDLALGVDILRHRMADADFPVLSANVQLSATGELLARPYALVDVAGKAVGLIGLTGRPAQDRANAKSGIDFALLPADDVLPACIAELRASTSIIIVLSTLGLEEDQRLSQMPGITMILGGSTRSPMPRSWANTTTGTLVVQAGSQGEWIGVRRLFFDQEHRLTKHADDLVYLTDDYPDDPQMRAFLDTYSAD